MLISLRWLNDYLSPASLSAEEADRLLTQAGFPIEETTPLPDGDVALDVEVTSNRGDCLSHVGCAREVAALPSASMQRALQLPEHRPPARRGRPIGEDLALVNHEPGACPLFTARLIRGCRIGESPAWLRERLEAVGQRPINNAVDVTNFITFELGNPCHVFDLKKLAKDASGRHALHIRYAREGETLHTLDERKRTLAASDLVVADAERAQSLAGVIGGKESEVDGGTTDIVLEMATWDPVTIRTAARRLQIRTDAGYRFERGVDARTIETAADRAAALICELTGGELAEGVLAEGGAMPQETIVSLRPSRVRLVMGIAVGAGEIERLLTSLGIETHAVHEDELRCRIPAWRPDLTREIDLIEEVARVKGLDAVPIVEKLPLRVRPPQAEDRAKRELGAALTGLGFYETVTFSFTTKETAEPFLAPGLRLVSVDEERRKGAPFLRPSVLCGLLGVRRANQDAGNEPAGGGRGGLRLYETAAVFAQTERGESVETANLGMLIDVPGEGRRRKAADKQLGLRMMRGAIDAAAARLGGPRARVEVRPIAGGAGALACWEPGAAAEVYVRVDLPGVDDAASANGDLAPGPAGHLAHSDAQLLGTFGLLSAAVLRQHDLDVPVVAAELNLEKLLDLYPPRTKVEALPAFPHTDRDVSLIVADAAAWASIEGVLAEARPERLESHAYVSTFRGEQIGAGKKSVTIRLRFRDPERTLRAEEVEPAVERFVALAKEKLGAELRA